MRNLHVASRFDDGCTEDRADAEAEHQNPLRSEMRLCDDTFLFDTTYTEAAKNLGTTAIRRSV